MLYIYIYSVNLTAYLNCSCAASLGSSAVPVIMLVDATVNEDGAVYCKHCEMWLNGPTQWEDHKIGKKHKKNVRQKDPHPRCWSSCNGVENAPYEPSMGEYFPEEGLLSSGAAAEPIQSARMVEGKF